MDILDYLQQRHKPENSNTRHKQKLGIQDRVAIRITNGIGTMYAVYFFGAFMLFWILWQNYITKRPFDPYPFAFLLFLGNIVQLLLMPLIMVGQNLQGKHAQVRADEEYQTTASSYKDIEQILLRLDAQDTEMKKQLDLILKLSNQLERQVKN